LKTTMLKSGFQFCCAMLLTTLCWLGQLTPSLALPLDQSISVAPTEIAMAKKPLFSFSGKRPDTLGVKEGRLATCPGTPNCVSSQATDAEHQVDAIAYFAPAAEVMEKLKSVVTNMERATVIEESSNYLYAEFTSGLMGFVDDVEFYLDDAAQVIHVRSASRLGQSDLGVNRKRVEEIRANLA
jgi:uncharacterized protein (DUF1499 family)